MEDFKPINGVLSLLGFNLRLSSRCCQDQVQTIRLAHVAMCGWVPAPLPAHVTALTLFILCPGNMWPFFEFLCRARFSPPSGPEDVLIILPGLLLSHLLPRLISLHYIPSGIVYKPAVSERTFLSLLPLQTIHVSSVQITLSQRATFFSRAHHQF